MARQSPRQKAFSKKYGGQYGGFEQRTVMREADIRDNNSCLRLTSNKYETPTTVFTASAALGWLPCNWK